MSDTSSSLPDDPAELRAKIVALEARNAAMRAQMARMQVTLKAHEALIQALQIRIAKLRRQKFGASSEKIEREIEQLELALEALEVAVSSSGDPTPEEDEDDGDVAPEVPVAVVPPRRRKPKVGAGTPRERVVLDPGECCPDCGGELRLVGEDDAPCLAIGPRDNGA